MIKGIRKKLATRIGEFFLQSRDFNGISLRQLAVEGRDIMGLDLPGFRRHIRALVRSSEVSLHFASHSENPYIKRLADLPTGAQLAKLDDCLSGEDVCCAYPAKSILAKMVDPSSYEGKPFTKRLMLGEPQLTPVFFDLDVLEKYTRDPRYSFEFHDYSGSIAISSIHYESPTVSERDKVLLSTFGIAYDPDRRRVVTVYLRYLSDLSPEHQQIWNAHVASESSVIDSDYARATLYGEWPEHHSAYQALITEQAEINKLCTLIGKPPFFREVFDQSRPKGFGPMLRPTKRNFDDFVHLLDKMMSENINKAFFEGDIPLKREQQADDGMIVEAKGTLSLLEEWLDTRYRNMDGKRVGNEVTGGLKELRALRQKPAHKIVPDEFDATLPNRQDEVVARVIRSLTSIRLILSSHPSARGGYSPPEWLDGNKIVFY